MGMGGGAGASAHSESGAAQQAHGTGLPTDGEAGGEVPFLGGAAQSGPSEDLVARAVEAGLQDALDQLRERGWKENEGGVLVPPVGSAFEMRGAGVAVGGSDGPTGFAALLHAGAGASPAVLPSAAPATPRTRGAPASLRLRGRRASIGSAGSPIALTPSAPTAAAQLLQLSAAVPSRSAAHSSPLGKRGASLSATQSALAGRRGARRNLGSEAGLLGPSALFPGAVPMTRSLRQEESGTRTGAAHSTPSAGSVSTLGSRTAARLASGNTALEDGGGGASVGAVSVGGRSVLVADEDGVVGRGRGWSGGAGAGVGASAGLGAG